MGLIGNEKSFPRGGKKPVITLPKKGSFNLFGKTSHKKSSQSKRSVNKKNKNNSPVSKLQLSHIEPLSLKTVKEGMLILGRIEEIEEFKMSIALPGRLIGTVPITNISTPYTNCLRNLVNEVHTEQTAPQLEDIFRVGQYVVAKVIETSQPAKHSSRITLSLMPDVVQSEWSHTSVVKGSVIVAAVKSQEDNGYIMDTGINNVRAFLKKSAAQVLEKTCNQGRALGVGHLVRCLVTKSDISSVASTVQLSADPRKVNKAVADTKEMTLDSVLPGTLLNAKVSKVLHNGLEINLGKQFIGCIHQDYLAEMWDTPQSYAKGDIHAARVLYVLPTVKFVHMTLNVNLFDTEKSDSPSNSLDIGSVVKAEIKHVDGYGVLVKVKDLKGFVPIRYCSISDSKSDPSMSYKELLLKKYEIGTKHKCKVLSYDYMTQQFVCTLDKVMIKSKVCKIGDLQPGMKIKCQIMEHTRNGALVTILGCGKLFTAFVQSLNMGNVSLSHPEKKFPEGSLHSARVLELQGNRIQLTLKPDLVKSRVPPLTRFEDVQIKMECEGVVALITRTGVLVTFYGDVKGWLQFGKNVKQGMFYIGQVIKCYVAKVDSTNKKMMLRLKQIISSSATKAKEMQTFQLGKAYRLTVQNVTDYVLQVQSDSESGIIPAQHLTDNPLLASLLLKTYVPGTIIESAFCFRDTIPPIFTLRPSLINYFQAKEGGNLSSVHENMLLPCAVKAITSSHVLLQLPLPKYSTTQVKLRDISNSEVQDATQLGLVKHQGLIARVLKIGQPRPYVLVTTKLSKCWDYSMEPCVSLLRGYWNDYDRIIEAMRKEGNPLANLEPGECVKGEVVAIEACGAVIKLECGAQGIATPMLSEENMVVGDIVEGTVIFIDLQCNCVELALNHNVRSRINVVQDGEVADNLDVGIGVRGEVLSVRQEMIVVLLKGAGRQQLAYVPSRCHPNDFSPNLSRYKIGETSKMIVQAVERGRIICVQQRFFFEVNKLKGRAMIAEEIRKKKEARQSKIDNCNSGIQNSTSGIKPGSAKKSSSKNSHKTSYDEKLMMTVSEDGDSSEGEEHRSIGEIEECSESNELRTAFSDSETEETVKGRKKRKKRRMSKGEDSEVKDDNKKRKTSLGDEVKDSKTSEPEQLSRLSLSAGFVWDPKPSLLPLGAATHQPDSSSEEEENVDKKEGKKKRLNRAERVAKASMEEQQLREAEQKLADMDRGPQSADDFDRLVLSSPNNSAYWIKYMAFHLQATEIEKARAIAQRALTTISFREEQEKLNVWCALLNLENLYGSKENLDKVFEEAVRMNDPFKVYTQMLQIYADSGKVQEAEKLASLLTKKFRDSKDAWLQTGEMLLKLGRLESARSVMQKALGCLENKLHVEIISKFAQLENRLGEPERAQTLMEHILTSYPKRIDIWSSYVDMLVKNGQLDAARQVLERGIAQKLPARKMKSLFTKFLQFEEHHGTPEGVQRVRQMAVDYVDSAVGTKEDDD
ncbi:rRNA biogenesis protein RRP5 isoform X2 [Periplaneta americana]